MHRFLKHGIFVLLFSAVALFVFISHGTGKVSAIDKNTYKNLKIFNEILNMVEKNYVEEVKQQDLIQGAISGMMRSLDPHSTFMTADEYKDLEVETKGSFGGIGIEITIINDVLTVVSPIEDTPAFHADVQSGDQIIKIDNQPTKDLSIREAVKKLRGPKDTKVTITIMRENLPKLKDITLTRNIIKIASVKSRLLDDGIAYYRIANFQEKTAEDLRRAIKELNAKAKPLGIILDLRNNPGGLLNQAVEVADTFLKAGVIVSTKGRSGAMNTTVSAKDDGNEPTCPIVVLVNEGSASASEIVAGALRDNGRGILLGTKTFGKGSVQTLIPLEDGAALKLTTAQYYTPSGSSIQAEGIVPDITLKYIKPTLDNSTENEPEAIREKDLKGHIKSEKENGVKTEDANLPQARKEKTDFVLDNQIKAAADMLKGWNIFMKGKNN